MVDLEMAKVNRRVNAVKRVKGGKITSLEELTKQEFVFYRDRLVQNGWFMSWQFRTVMIYMHYGLLFYAIPEEKCVQLELRGDGNE